MVREEERKKTIFASKRHSVVTVICIWIVTELSHHRHQLGHFVEHLFGQTVHPGVNGVVVDGLLDLTGRPFCWREFDSFAHEFLVVQHVFVPFKVQELGHFLDDMGPVEDEMLVRLDDAVVGSHSQALFDEALHLKSSEIYWD